MNKPKTCYLNGKTHVQFYNAIDSAKFFFFNGK